MTEGITAVNIDILFDIVASTVSKLMPRIITFLFFDLIVCMASVSSNNVFKILPPWCIGVIK